MALHILEDLTNRFPQFSAHYQRINECAQKTELEFVVHRLAYKRNVAIDLKFRFPLHENKWPFAGRNFETDRASRAPLPNALLDPAPGLELAAPRCSDALMKRRKKPCGNYRGVVVFYCCEVGNGVPYRFKRGLDSNLVVECRHFLVPAKKPSFRKQSKQLVRRRGPRLSQFDRRPAPSSAQSATWRLP